MVTSQSQGDSARPSLQQQTVVVATTRILSHHQPPASLFCLLRRVFFIFSALLDEKPQPTLTDNRTVSVSETPSKQYDFTFVPTKVI